MTNNNVRRIGNPLGKGEVHSSILCGSTSNISRIPLYPYK
jgi:hypothetical protein